MTIRWGIIGCGDVCEVKSGPAFYKVPGSALTMVMRRDAARARDFAERHHVPRFTTDADALIEDPEVDAVYIATPPGAHLEYALRVARAKKPCYVEKPMARSAAECEVMLAAFEASRTPLFVAYYRRALPRFLEVQRVLGSGVLGELLTVSHVHQGRVNPARAGSGLARAGWREQPAQSGGGLFLDLGSHVIDIIDFLLGPLSDVNGLAAHRTSGPRPPLGAPEDTVVFSFRTASGVLGTSRFQFHTSGAADRLELVGTRGSVSLSVFGQEPIELSLGDARETIAVRQPEHVHAPLVDAIVRELGGAPEACPSTGRTALRASSVMDRVLDAYYGGRSDAFWSRPETWPGARGT